MKNSRSGRRLLGFAALLTALAICAWLIQLFVLESVIAPWYVPALGAIAVGLAVVAFLQSPSIVRGLVALLVIGVGSLEVYFVFQGSLLPKYNGPIQAGTPFPAFTADRAGGGAFSDVDLRGTPTVLVFFRGRW